MVSPVQFSNNRQVYFGNDDIISAPGAFQKPVAAEMPADEVVLSSQEAPKKKGGVGKTIAKILGTAVVVAGALFGLTKWKGEKWLNPEATKFGDKLKNWLCKPGEWMEAKGKAILEKCGIGKGKAKPEAESKIDELVDEIEAEIEASVGPVIKD